MSEEGTTVEKEKGLREVEAPQQDVLNEAWNLIRGQRAKDYGPPHVNFEQIANLWQAALENRDLKERPLTGEDVSILMILLKMARLITGQGYHRDSVVDIAGYTAILEVLQMEPEEFIAQIQ